MVEPKGKPTPASRKPKYSTYPTGPGTVPANKDVADPHASDEGDPYDERHTDDTPHNPAIGTNPALHNGTGLPRRKRVFHPQQEQ